MLHALNLCDDPAFADLPVLTRAWLWALFDLPMPDA